MAEVILTTNQYGKAENRVVRVSREGTDRHEVVDLNVTSQLRGDFAAAHLQGDNGHVVATDTQKNTVFAFAREPISSPEEFLLKLAEHFTSSFDWVTGGRWAADEYGWTRIADHDHAFYRGSPETRTAVVVRDGDTDAVISGFYGLTVMKTTKSGFVGYPKDRYTTLAETEDRILATDVSTKWRYNADAVSAGEVDFDAAYETAKSAIMERFTQGHSKALQETLYQMAGAVVDALDVVDEVKFSCPNKHHFLSDLDRFGLDNPNVVYYAADRPYGLIEATFQRKGAPAADAAWNGIAGFC